MKNFILAGKVVSKTKTSGIAGLSVQAVLQGQKRKLATTLTNEDGGFHFIFQENKLGENAKIQVVVYSIDKKEVAKTKKTVQVKFATQAEVEIAADDELIREHLSKTISLKPVEGRIFPVEKLNQIYGAINLYGNTKQKYSFSGDIRPGLTCPFPELNDYDNLLTDAWETLQGDPSASQRFKNTLETVALSMEKRRGLKTRIDFNGAKWKSYIKEKRLNHDHDAMDHDPVVPLEKSALLMMGANYIAGKDKKLANKYMNVVLSQLLEFYDVAPIYRTCRNAMLGDTTAQSNVRNMIDIWGEDCEGRNPLPDIPGRGEWDPRVEPIDPDLEDNLACLDDFVNDLRLHEKHEYSINSLTPDNGCSGDIAVIGGSGFGNVAGRVRFVGARIGSTVFADPISWSNTRIEVTIPNGATYGPISLEFPHRVGRRFCRGFTSIIPHNVSSHTTDFKGGRPRIDSISFTKNNVPFDPMTETVLPGETVSLIYENSPNAPRHSVDIRESQIRFDNGQFNPSVSIQEFNTLFQGFDVPSHTNHQLPAMNYDRSTKITCELDLTNHCGTTHGSAYFIVHRPSTVSLTGIEVTQAIQFFRSDEIIPNQDEWQPDNSVPLIANKPTLVRVYANSNQIRSFNNGCTFGLDIKLRGFKDGRELANSAISAINSNVLFASSDNSVNFQKGNLASSADFLLPTNWITPSVAYYHPIDQSLIQLKLVAELGIRPYEPWQRDNIDLIDDTLTATGISFNSAISLKCILVRIAYEGPNHVSTDPPTHEECVKVLNDIVHAYPTADVEILLPAEIPPHALSGVQILQADLTDAGEGGCGIGWGRLLDLLSNIKHAHEEPADAIWVALLHPSIPTSVAGGCGAGGLAAFPVDQPKVGMQEIGHAFGRSHSFEDDNYPEYGYPNFSDNPVAGDDSIGDFGVDVGGFNSSPTWNNLRIYVPTNTADFMSYLGKPKWVSPYTYTALMRNFLFDPLGDFLLRDSIAVNDRSEQIVISGSINLRTNEVDLRPLYHQRRFKKNASGTPTDYFIVLLDKFEKILVKTAVIKLYESGTNFLRILQAVPFHKGVKHIEIRQNQETLTRISRRDKLVTISHLTLSEKGNTRRLKWKIEGQENGYWCGVELTCDNGRSWTRLSEIQAITSFSCDVTHFGGGEKCRLRVFVTDGFNTTYQETNTFSLPIKSPHIIPINFNSETEFIAGYSYELQVQPIYILGVPHQTELLWFLDDKEIGKGKRVSVQFEEGKHEIRIVPEKFKEAALVVQVIAKKEDR